MDNLYTILITFIINSYFPFIIKIIDFFTFGSVYCQIKSNFSLMYQSSGRNFLKSAINNALSIQEQVCNICGLLSLHRSNRTNHNKKLKRSRLYEFLEINTFI